MPLYVSFQLSQVWLTRSRNNLMLVFEKDLKLPNLIQEGIAITNEVDVNVIRLWKLVESIKLELFHYILVEDSIGCEIAS